MGLESHQNFRISMTLLASPNNPDEAAVAPCIPIAQQSEEEVMKFRSSFTPPSKNNAVTAPADFRNGLGLYLFRFSNASGHAGGFFIVETVRGQTALKQVSQPSGSGIAPYSIVVGQPLRLNSFPAFEIKILIAEHGRGKPRHALLGQQGPCV